MSTKKRKLDWLRAELPIAEAVSHAQLDAYAVLKKAFNLRAEKGMTLSKLAEKLDRNKSQVSRLLNGAGAGMTLESLAAYLAVLEHDLFLAAVPYEEMPSLENDALSVLHPKVETRAIPSVTMSSHSYFIVHSPVEMAVSQPVSEKARFKSHLVPCT
ncbi:helix-turn-helix domain-containing protein [Labrys sp. ZIDIC5]|uniref:helix-turn-helix domain-containing protein n=1 Tax=Labrys sedimenti TaxID=3106036 RepID=UPI002ACA927D|nr:helix-turn-helix domain-containing protein [Labrys sp. ZIDIC5]MDZ5448933.1 helix-turn-helix domain-containing protein [Labrys sp. ZIDIC5]